MERGAHVLILHSPPLARRRSFDVAFPYTAEGERPVSAAVRYVQAGGLRAARALWQEAIKSFHDHPCDAAVAKCDEVQGQREVTLLHRLTHHTPSSCSAGTHPPLSPSNQPPMRPGESTPFAPR